jgi:hypothetical protein
VFQHYYIANSNFPKHKLQILAIDDGSKRWYLVMDEKAKEQLEIK